jgi:hypothetical protein
MLSEEDDLVFKIIWYDTIVREFEGCKNNVYYIHICNVYYIYQSSRICSVRILFFERYVRSTYANVFHFGVRSTVVGHSHVNLEMMH